MRGLTSILLTTVLPLAAVLSSCISVEVPVTQNYVTTENATQYVTESYTENATFYQASSGEFELAPSVTWSSIDVTFYNGGNLFYYGYDVPDAGQYDNISVRIEIATPPQLEFESLRVFDVTNTGHLTYPEPPPAGEETETTIEIPAITGKASNKWLNSANVLVSRAKFLGGRVNQWSNEDNPQSFVLNAGKASKIAVIIVGPENQWNTYVRLYVLWTVSSPAYGPVTRQRTVEKQMPTQVTRQRTYYEVRQVPFWEGLPHSQ